MYMHTKFYTDANTRVVCVCYILRSMIYAISYYDSVIYLIY